MQQQKLRVMIANDQTLVREGLASVLKRQKQIEIVAQTADPANVISDFQRHRPNVLLLDARIGGADSIDTMRRLLEQFPKAAVLMIGSSSGSEEIYRALRSGARGYILKDVSDTELVQAIEMVASGRRHLSQTIAEKLAERMDRSTLTSREMEVLQLIVKGNSNKEIADALNVTEGTVKYHVNSILTKLGVADRTQAATAALLRGIIHPQDL